MTKTPDEWCQWPIQFRSHTIECLLKWCKNWKLGNSTQSRVLIECFQRKCFPIGNLLSFAYIFFENRACMMLIEGDFYFILCVLALAKQMRFYWFQEFKTPHTHTHTRTQTKKKQTKILTLFYFGISSCAPLPLTVEWNFLEFQQFTRFTLIPQNLYKKFFFALLLLLVSCPSNSS